MDVVSKSETSQKNKSNATSARGMYRFLLPILFVLVVLLAGTTFYFYRKTNTDENAVSQKEVKTLVGKIGKLIVLPEEETPTVATVADPEVLKDQIFFAQAEKGDKVLIYTNAKKAILYSVSKGKVITIAPLNSPDSPKTTPTEPSPESTKKSDKK